MLATLGKNSAFAQVNIDDMVSLERALDGKVDLFYILRTSAWMLFICR